MSNGNSEENDEAELLLLDEDSAGDSNFLRTRSVRFVGRSTETQHVIQPLIQDEEHVIELDSDSDEGCFDF